MPVVVNPADDGKKFNLETAPPDGFVVIKRLDYGQSLTRQSMTTKISIGGSGSNSKDFSGELDIDQKAVALYDFANCILDHNLTNASGIKYNFKSAQDVSALPRVVGEEIGTLIDDYNNIEQSDEVKN